MKALSIAPDWGMLMYQGEKTIECRTWQTDYRGDILFCTTKKLIPGCISGHALFTARLADIKPFTKAHMDKAAMDFMPQGKNFAWFLSDFHFIYPFPVKGKQGFFEVDDSLIKYIPNEMSDEEADKFIQDYLNPLIYKPARL